MREIVFSGSTLAADLTIYIEHLSQLDPWMTQIFHNNISTLTGLNIDDEVGRKNARTDFNAAVKSILDKSLLTESDLEGSRVPPPQQSPEATSARSETTTPAKQRRYYLVGLSVEGFRGIKNEGDPLEIKFDPHSVNSVFGQNGMGKSSLFEALQYAIRGTVPRLAKMQSSEKPENYMANLFHSTRESTIKLTLSSDDGAPNVEIEVQRSSSGERTVTSPTGCTDPEKLLESLNQDFTLLDYSTFVQFIDDSSLVRGRSFSALLGLSDYASFRRVLQSLVQPQAFSNDFSLTSLESTRDHVNHQKRDAFARFTKAYAEVTEIPLDKSAGVTKWATNLAEALGKEAILKEEVSNKTLSEIDFEDLRQKVLIAERSTERQKLNSLLDRYTKLSNLDVDNAAADFNSLVAAVKSRDTALRKSKGKHIHDLNKAADNFLKKESNWNKHVCPLCESNVDEPIDALVNETLETFSEFETRDKGLKAEILDSDFLQRLTSLEELDLIDQTEGRFSTRIRESISQNSFSNSTLHEAKKSLDSLEHKLQHALTTTSATLREMEATIPPSLVSLTEKIAFAESAREALKSYVCALSKRDSVVSTLETYKRWKDFAHGAYEVFATAEATLSKRTLHSLRTEYRRMFAEVMSSASEVVPELTRSKTKENMSIELSDFYTTENVPAQAVLSESYRNALAISVFLAAALKHSRMPRFIVLDDATSSFDAGHQYALMEQIRTKFQVPVREDGLQFILFSHDVNLEKYFNRLGEKPGWSHQKLHGRPPLTPVSTKKLEQNHLKTEAKALLDSGKSQEAVGYIRQYLESVLDEIVRGLKIPVPIDMALNDNQRMAQKYINAIETSIDLHKMAGTLVLTSEQMTNFQTYHSAALIGNMTNHLGTGGDAVFAPAALHGTLDAVDRIRRCFQYDSDGQGKWKFYRTLTKK